MFLSCSFVFVLSSAPPHISVPSSDRIEAVVGDMVWLPCATDAASEAMLQWSKDGENIHRGWSRFKVVAQSGPLDGYIYLINCSS